MRTNKFRLSLAVAGLLVAAGVSSAAAETDGWFVGAQLGYSNTSLQMDGAANITLAGYESVESINDTASDSALSYGILGGYKQFFTPKFAARYYGLFAYAKHSDVSAYNINANVDALYNFAKLDSVEFGVFGGLSLGYAVYSNLGEWNYMDGLDITDVGSAKGFDLGLNFGLRANIAEHHGVELYSRFGFLETKKTFAKTHPDADIKVDYKFKQPYQFGIRYTYSF